jgi:excisionase family DNA binding protein
MSVEQHHSGLMTAAEAASFLRVAVGTLTQWRCTDRVRIPFVKIGSLVRYHQADLVQFVQEQRHESH